MEYFKNIVNYLKYLILALGFSMLLFGSIEALEHLILKINIDEHNFLEHGLIAFIKDLNNEFFHKSFALTVLGSLIATGIWFNFFKQRQLIMEKDTALKEVNSARVLEMVALNQMQVAMEDSSYIHQLLDGLIENMPVGIILFNPSGQCIVANETARNMIGCSREKMFTHNWGRNGTEVWNRSELFFKALKSLITDETQTLEFKEVSSYGKEMCVQIAVSSIIINNMPYLLKMMWDISELTHEKEERHKIEGALAAICTICHEMSQPFQIIMAEAQLMQMYIEKIENPCYVHNMLIKKSHSIIGAVERLGKITQKLTGLEVYKTRDYARAAATSNNLLDINSSKEGGVICNPEQKQS